MAAFELHRSAWVGAVAWAALVVVLAGHGCAFNELSVARCGGFLDEATPDCRACSETACCAEASACRESEACTALYGCIDTCAGNPNCEADCGAAHPADAAAAVLARCHTDLCTECAPCAGYFQLNSPTCDDCTRTTCCAEAKACFADEACHEHAICANACTAPHCDRQCNDLHPLSDESLALWNALGDCAIGTCRSECGIGEQFGCVGEFAWPAPIVDEVTFTGRYHTGSTTWHAGMAVAACGRDDFNCDAPLAEGVTDADGEVVLTIPVQTGFIGFFQVAGNDIALPLLQAQTAPLYHDEERSFDMLTRDGLAGAAEFLNFELELDKGVVFAFPEDCINQRAPGIELVIEGNDLDGITPFYFDNGLPSVGLTETVPGMGGGGWANVPSGLYTVRAVRSDTREEVAFTQLISRAGTVTSTTLSPKP